jgi:diguanylate cyclase (GGDEF)-like protein
MAKRDKRRVGIIFHDLDHFKPVNDAYGHRVGDLLLRAVAERVQERVRASDTVGRIGGDEFVIVLPDIADVSDILVVAEKMREALRQSFVIEGHVLHLSTSIGISIYPEHGTTESELIVNADNAMYCAKRRGRDGFCVYQAGVQQAGRRE